MAFCLSTPVEVRGPHLVGRSRAHSLDDSRRQVDAGESLEAVGEEVGCKGRVAAAQHQDAGGGVQVRRHQVPELPVALEPLILLLLDIASLCCPFLVLTKFLTLPCIMDALLPMPSLGGACESG